LELRDRENGPEVLIGAGVNAAVIRNFRAKLPHARAFHMSGKLELESAMVFRREGVPMGLPGLDEWHIQQTDDEIVRLARMALDA
jgi:copper homeostasis protein